MTEVESQVPFVLRYAVPPTTVVEIERFEYDDDRQVGRFLTAEGWPIPVTTHQTQISSTSPDEPDFETDESESEA